MRQIVWNVISNAIKFTPKSGEILVRLQKRATSYHIDVTDTGIGLEKDQLHRIFDRFSQVQEGKSRSGGLGLGLSIVKALVELHGGRISAHSPGKDLGTTFKLSFPLYELKSEEVLEAPAAAPAGPQFLNLHGTKVLIAEDQTEAAAALAFTLKKWGADLTLVHDGATAFKALVDQRFDLILSDIGMPEMDGLDLLRTFRRLEIQRGSTPIPAIALTAYATSKDRIQCLESGFQSHLPKPVERTELLAVIKSLGFGMNGVPL